MAIFHLSVKIISRSSGRSAIAAAAYRAGEKLKNEEKGGKIHDFSRKKVLFIVKFNYQKTHQMNLKIAKRYGIKSKMLKKS